MILNRASILVGGGVIKIYAKILRDAGCLNFIADMAEKDIAEFAKLPILSEEAAAVLKQNLQERLEGLYLQILLHSLKDAVKEFDSAEYILPSGKSVEALQKAAQKVYSELTTDFGASLKRIYTLLGEYELKIRDNFREAIQEFFDRFFLRKNEISEKLFDGKPITKIKSFSMSGADTHRHGRTVMRVETDAGIFYYKPHDCLLDVLYHEIVTNWFSDCTIAAKIVGGKDYGFVQELKFSEVETAEDIGKYFYNFGALTAIFHGVGSNDMHAENILACGVYPCAIDLETFFSAPKFSLDTQKNLQAAIDVLYSVENTAVMPARIHLEKMTSPLFSEDENVKSLPGLYGKKYTVKNYVEEFIAGFRDGYGRMYEHKTEILNLVNQTADAIIRFVPKNTAYYAYMLNFLFRSENILCVENRDKILSKLKKDNDESALPIIEYEEICLCESEIPYFCVKADGYALCGGDANEILKEKFFKTTALDGVRFRLNRLSDAELDFEEKYIRVCFKHAATDENISVEDFPITVEVNSADAIKIAEEIFTEILAEVIHAIDKNILWHCYVLNQRFKPSLGILTPQANVVQYCAKILKCKSLAHLHEDANKLAEKCLSGIVAQIKLWEKYPQENLAVGIYDGLGGLILAGAELGNYELIGRILKICEKISFGDEINLADGSAGFILALAKLENLPVENLIRKCAENILSKKLPEEVSASKGLAGIGAALAAAYKFTGDKKFLNAAIETFEKIRAEYLENICGWTDGKNNLAWLAKRAPKSAGIGIYAIRAANFYPAEIFNEVAQLALKSVTAEKKLFWNDSLNQGNALSILFLTEAAKKFNRPEYLQKAEQILFAMNQRRADVGNFRITEKGVRTFFESSMFVGTLGIGYAALSMEELK